MSGSRELYGDIKLSSPKARSLFWLFKGLSFLRLGLCLNISCYSRAEAWIQHGSNTPRVTGASTENRRPCFLAGPCILSASLEPSLCPAHGQEATTSFCQHAVAITLQPGVGAHHNTAQAWELRLA